MSYIRAKNKKRLIKTLKKMGDDVIIVKCDIIYSFPKGMYKSHRDEFKKYPERFKYYRVKVFVRKLRFKRNKT